jgi:uncharacterized membrane protein
MSTLVAWKFDTCDGAERGGRTLQQRLSLSEGSEDKLVRDAARVSWSPGGGKPTTAIVPLGSSDAALGETFWGVLFGVIFFAPLLDAAAASATGGGSDGLADLGIDEVSVNRVRDAVTPGTSALFVIGADSAIDRVSDALRDEGPVPLLHTKLGAVVDSSMRHVGAR